MFLIEIIVAYVKRLIVLLSGNKNVSASPNVSTSVNAQVRGGGVSAVTSKIFHSSLKALKLCRVVDQHVFHYLKSRLGFHVKSIGWNHRFLTSKLSKMVKKMYFLFQNLLFYYFILLTMALCDVIILLKLLAFFLAD